MHGNKTNLCPLCRGTKLLCGKIKCPVLVQYHSQNKIKPLINSTKIYGASPPSIFIGRIGYPKISIGPMIPPKMGNTELYDSPERWLDKSIEDIIDFRSLLVRGKHRIHISDVDSTNKMVSFTRELALAKDSVYTEASFYKKPKGSIRFYTDIQPHGPSAQLKKFDISNPKYDHHMEKAYYDTDLKSLDAILHLYKQGVSISKINKAFGVGAFGIGKYRKFVPTRWSITAVDSNIGQTMIKQTKTYPWINEFQVYYIINLITDGLS